MDQVEKQQQQNQPQPQNIQNQIKENPIPELANHSSKQVPIFHESDEEKQQMINDLQQESQHQNIVLQETEKPEQFFKQMAYCEIQEEKAQEKIKKITLNDKELIMDINNKEIMSKIGDGINELADNQKKQPPVSKQNEDKHELIFTVEDQQPKQNDDDQQIRSEKRDHKIEGLQKNSSELEEKQKIRQNTQLMESSFNDKERPLLQFEQYQQSTMANNQSCSPILLVKPQQQIKNKQELAHVEGQNSNKEDLILPKVQSSIQSSIQNSPRKEGAGKIARKKLHEKGIYDALLSLQKRDKQHKEIYELAQKHQLSTNKIDLSKLQTNITLNSNVVNVTVIEPPQQPTEEQKLLIQVQQLRKKLFNLQITKNREEDSITSNKSLSALYNNQEYIHLENTSQQEESSEGDYYISSKHDRRRNIGKFYRIVENNNAKISEQLRIFGFQSKSKYQKQTYSARKPKTNSFRVRKNNKSNYLSNQKDNFIQQIPQNDECFQVKRKATQKLLFDQDDKLNFIQKPFPRNLSFSQNFKQYVRHFFIPKLLQKPHRNNSESQLVQLAKNAFNKFGVNIKQDKTKVLHVQKYKNCVSFILDNSYTIIWHYEGRFYLGGWQVDQNGDGHKLGWGYEDSPDKFTYSGQFKENKRDGYGIMRIYSKNNEIIYQGNWKQGAKHGLGKQLQADSSIYIGEWQNGKKEGQGKIIISDCEEYDGQFKDGLKWGKGKQKFKNGDNYHGEYSQGKFHGKGIYIWNNFSRYQGSFVEGRRCGNGKWALDYRNPQTDYYQGQYLNDKKHGFGKYHWKDGTIYEGEFQNDLKHGEGVITEPSGRVVRLDWIQGNIVTKRATVQIGENEAVTSRIKNQSFKNQESKKTEKSIKALKLNLQRNKRSNPMIPT